MRGMVVGEGGRSSGVLLYYYYFKRDDKPNIVSFLRTFKFQAYSLGDNSYEDATVGKR